jgi:hypothetical protein
MGCQPRYGERASRFSLRRLRTRSSAASGTSASRRATLTRYGLRALVVAGAASAAWFFGTQVASAAPAHQEAAPKPSSQAGLIGTASSALGSLTEALSGSGGCAAGDTCARPGAAAHHGSAHQGSTDADQRSSSRTAPVANAADAAPGVVHAVSTHLPVPAGIGNPGQEPVFGPVLDVTRPVTGSLGTETSPTASAPSQGPAIGMLTGVLRPVTSTLTNTARPVTGVLAGPLATTTRPVAGLLTTAARPLPGACGAVVTPLTGVLANGTGALPGTTVPAEGTAYQAVPHSGLVLAARHWAGAPFATWTDPAGFAGHVSGTPVPGFPEPTPPAYPGSGLSSGGTASSSGAHAGFGAYAPAASPVVSADSASRVALGTTQADLPRLHEVDPVISPD